MASNASTCGGDRSASSGGDQGGGDDRGASSGASSSGSGPVVFHVQDRVEVFFGDQTSKVEMDRAASGAEGVEGWYAGIVTDIATQLVSAGKRKKSGSADTILTIKFDDGEVRRDIRPHADWRVRHVAAAQDDATCSSHAPLDYRCGISFLRLDDPARGANCAHLACFNYKALSRFVAANRRCPHAMCDKPLSAVRQIRRDEWLQQALSRLPADTPDGAPLFVQHGVDVRTRRPDSPGGRAKPVEQVIDLGESPAAKLPRADEPGDAQPPPPLQIPPQMPPPPPPLPPPPPPPLPVQTPAPQQPDEPIVLSDDESGKEALYEQSRPRPTPSLTGASFLSSVAVGAGQSKEEAIECGSSDED